MEAIAMAGKLAMLPWIEHSCTDGEIKHLAHKNQQKSRGKNRGKKITVEKACNVALQCKALNKINEHENND